MKKTYKVWLAILAAIILGVSVYLGVKKSRAGIVTVQTGTVVRQDLIAIVTASGEIKPRNYINIGANAMGRITEILVKEGDSVRKGQLLARLESVQAAADVQAQKAALSSAEAESTAAESSVR
ncbi:MAG: biotin/lipoyl-binding protein, partial [Planctomycetota bacterium]